jgi:hypothetical protein
MPTSIHSAIVILASILLAAAPVRSPIPRPAQIILIRHADKPADPDDAHLSPAGVQRAQQLVPFVTTDPAMTRFGLPVAVFATRSTPEGTGVRTQETVAPLAKALGVPVETPFLGSQYAALASRVLDDPAYAGKTVLICWDHSEIPRLAAALGVTNVSPKWQGSVFDQVYAITYSADRAVLSISHYGSPSVQRPHGAKTE